MKERESKDVKFIYELSPFFFLKPSEIVAQASTEFLFTPWPNVSFKFVGNPCSLFSNTNKKKKMLSLLTKNVFGRFMTQTTITNNIMTLRNMATKTNKTAKLKGALKVKSINEFDRFRLGLI